VSDTHAAAADDNAGVGSITCRLWVQWGVMPCGWEGNRRSGVAQAMRH